MDLDGLKQKEIAQIARISLSSVKNYIRIYKNKGMEGLILKNRVVKYGTNRKLNFEQSKTGTH